MNKKQIVRALGIFVVLALAFFLSRSILENQALPIVAQPTGPNVAARNPIEGQRLNLDSPIEITFDRDMDQGKTSEAFSFIAYANADVSTGASQTPATVRGKTTWRDARTLTFAADKPLSPATTYKAIISTQAAATDGINLQENIELEFVTVDALAVAQIFPASDTDDVDLNTSITIIFNHPVVPLKIKEEQSNLPQPLQITPAVKGKGEWVNSSVYVFQPEKMLMSGISYEVKVEAGLKDMNGNALAESFDARFTTRRPIISNYGLTNGPYHPDTEVKGVPLDQAFFINFGQPMNKKSVEGATRIINRETREAFPIRFKWNDDFTALSIEPDGKYKIAGFYELILADSAQAEDGGTLKEGLDIKIATVPLPSIVKVYPAANSKNAQHTSYIQITFASPMDFESMKGRVLITPAIKGEPQQYYNYYDRSLYIYGLEPATDYIVRILPGMKDPYGNEINDEISYEFRNGDYAPYARLALPWTPLTYRANGSQEIFFEHLNLDEAVISVYPLTLKDFGDLESGKVSKTSFNPGADPVREWKVASQKRNETNYERFLLNENGQSLAPGYYFVGLQGKPLQCSERFCQGFLFVIATDNVTFKATPTEGLAWVTDLESGVPQAGITVAFYNNEFAEIGKTKTDKNGVAYLKDISNPYYVAAEGSGRFGFTSSYWGSGVSTGDFGIYQNYYAGAKSIFGYIYTDRPVYRPTQEVYFKGIMRQDDDMHYSLPTQKQVYIVAEQWGQKIFTEYVDVNEQGSFSGTIKLAEGASLGSYTIYAYENSSPDQGAFASVGFNVAEYKKPEFEVIASADQANVIRGDTANFGMDAKYYSGGILKNAQVDWFIESTPFYFTPASKYGEYNFMDWDRDVYWSPEKSSAKNTLKEGKGTTDQEGHFEVPLELNLGEENMSQQISFYANVTDVAGNTVSGGTSVIAHQSEVYAGIRSEKYIGVQGEASNFNLVVLDWDSNPVANQSVSVEFVERHWYSVQKKDKQGQLRWETSVEETSIARQGAITDANGMASVSFTPRSGGVYKAIVTVIDSKKNKQIASAYIWVSSKEYIAWQQNNERSFDLIADKDEYKPGDTAEILIAQPFEEKVYALVTYERGHIYKQEVLLLDSSSTVYQLPITDELAPVAYVSVTVISGAGKTGIPNFKIGMTRINIDVKQKTLDVQVTADKETAGPGDEVTYTIETKDFSGKPVSADVSIAVADKAALALAPRNSPPMLASFYPIRGLSVTTALGLVSNADEYNENYKKTIPDGGGSGGGGGGELGIITVRQNFKDTAFFKAQVITDENGRAQVTVKLPENLTTWHADVRAVTDDSRVGEGEHELFSTKPLYAQLQTPRFFVVGDEAQVGAIIHNNTDKKLSVNVSLDAQGVILQSDAQQTIEVEAKQQAYAAWLVTVENNVQRVDMTVTATSGQYTDASKPPLGFLPDNGLPVYNFTVDETVGTSGMITSSNSATEGIQLPTTYTFTDAQLNVEVSPSLAASMQSSLKYLEDYPYLCMEQTVSRFLPNVIASRALKLSGIESPLQTDLDANVSAALQRIYAKQLPDGGWNWWDGYESDPQTSAYVVYGLIEAKESGYEISETTLSRGVEYLGLHLPNIRRNASTWEFNRYAFMTYVLARADALDAGATNLVFEYRDALDLYGKAYLAQALYLMDPQDSRISTLMSDLATATVMSSSGAHWEEYGKDYWNWNSDTRTTAIVLNAFTQIEPKNPVTANAVRWLMAHREGGHWYSTQETTWSLIALTNWLVVSKEYETDYKYAIGLNGELLQEGQATTENLTDPVKLQIELQDLLKDQVNYLVLTRGSGTGNLYYSAYLTATMPVEEIQPLDQGVSLSREYFIIDNPKTSIDDPKTPITEIALGELVKVRLTIIAPASLHYAVINDPLPAGLEAIDTTLQTDTAVPQVYTMQDYDERGWGWWYFDHIELRDEKVVLSTDYLPAGTYVYTYLARASTKGTFKVIPPTASEFYFPDVGGRGAGSVFVVK